MKGIKDFVPTAEYLNPTPDQYNEMMYALFLVFLVYWRCLRVDDGLCHAPQALSRDENDDAVGGA